MFRCILCRFEVELDDVKLNHGNGAVVCLRCYTREVEADRAMAARYRRNVQRAIDGDTP